MFEREFDERVSSLQIEFKADLGALISDRARADFEFIGDLATGFEFGKRPQNAPFAWRQTFDSCLSFRRRITPQAFRQKRCQQRAEIFLSGEDVLNTPHDFRRGFIF